MRVNLDDAPNSQRGVSIILFTIFLSALLGAAAFTIDLGHSWQERRNLITATDAAALAAAQDYALGGNGCAGTAVSYLTQNYGGATLDSCTPNISGESGYVTVWGSANVDYIFGDIIGISDNDISSASSAQWEPAGSVASGLRPFGICVDFFNALVPPPVPDNGVEYVIQYGKDSQPDACGADIPGNWAVLDFDGGSNPQGEINCWVEFGYGASECPYNAPIVPCPVPDPPCVEGNTGAFSNAMNQQMARLRDSGDCFVLPLFQAADGPGANAMFNINEFIGAVLVDYLLTGPEEDRFFTIKIVPCVIQGEPGPGPGTGVKVLGICGVDNDTTGC